MALFTHTVTTSTVLAGLPFAEGTVTSTSSGLNTGVLASWIEEAAGHVNAILVGRGLDPTALDANTAQVAKSCIHAYARAMALTKRQFPADEVSRQWELYNSGRKTLRDLDELGASGAAADGVSSNVRASKGCATKALFGREFGW